MSQETSSSTPRRHSSGDQHSTSPQSQQETMDRCALELDSHTWEFDPETVSRMLSPKTLKEPYLPEDILSFEDLKKKLDCTVDHPFFTMALDTVMESDQQDLSFPADSTKERSFYVSLIKFLNNSIEVCHKALNAHLEDEVPQLNDRWNKTLQFVTYDKNMADGVEGSHPVKPDAVGVRGAPSSSTMPYWFKRNHEDDMQIEVPVGVEGNWRELVKQAATYARCLFSASVTRTWALVLGFNHSTRSLRFLIFHRGGCTASKDISLMDAGGRKEACRLILTMLLWTKPHHAGFNSCCTEDKVAVPADIDGQSHKMVKVRQHLHLTSAIRTRGTWVALVSAIEESSGTAMVDASARLAFRPPKTSPSEGLTSQTRNKATSNKDAKSSDPSSRSNKAQQGSEKVSTKSKDKSGNTKSPSKNEDTDGKPIIPGNRRYVPVYRPPPNIKGREQDMEAISTTEFLLKYYWPSEDDPIEPHVLKATSGAFGTPAHICCYHPVDPDGLYFSNRIFLPPAEKVREAWWQILATDPPTTPNYRKGLFVLLGALGEPLLYVKSSWELCEAITHASLGWLNYYQAGYLHRDISIGNVLRLKKPRIMDPFKALVEEVLGADVDIASSQEPIVSEMSRQLSLQDDVQAPITQDSHEPSSVSLQQTSAESNQVSMDPNPLDPPGSLATVETVNLPESIDTGPSTYAMRIKTALEKLGVTSQCKAILTDGDMAGNWKVYFAQPHDLHTKSGTPEFMSLGLHDAMESSEPYLQSPVDDHHSFFWVTMWAVMFNELNQKRSAFEKRCHHLLVDNAGQRESVLMLLENATLSKALFTQPTSPILKQMAEVLIEWHKGLNALQRDWARQVLGNQPEGAGEKWFLPWFHWFAFRGVAELLELMLKHRPKLMKYEPFS